MPSTTKLYGPTYIGGKSAASPTGTGKWIASMLPWDADGTYAEPFAGMCGVLLQRRPMRWEWANDLDDVVVNWWEVVRDQPDELSYAIHNTPRSQTVYEESVRVARDLTEPPIRRALAFLVIQQQSTFPGRNGWMPGYTDTSEDWRRDMHHRTRLLCDRLRNVQLTNENATETLARLADQDNAIIYCDPPYAGTFSPYGANVEHDELARALLAQKGRAMISGYGDEWDDLGWERHERVTFTPTAAGSLTNDTERTEVAWANFDVANRGQQALPL